MIAAIATLMFLLVLALVGFIGWRTLIENGERIAVAVEGLPPLVRRSGPASAAA